MVARVSEGISARAVGASFGVGIDLGRHRVYAGAGVHSFGHPIPLSNQHAGLLIRWVGEGGPQRVTERVQALAGTDQESAIGFVSLVAKQISRGLPETIPDIPKDADLRIRAVAVPASFGPMGRAAVVEGFARSGINIQPQNIVARPVAALAGWFAHRQQISGRPPRDPVLLLDNDGGELSAIVADPLTRRLLLCMPLSSGPNDNPAWVIERLREVISAAAGLLHREGVLQDTDWPSVSAALPQVVVTGSGHHHPAIASLVHSLLPAADVMPDPLISDPAHCVVLGLQHLDVFDDWRACWPTSDMYLDSQVLVDSGQILYRQDQSYVVKPGSELKFGSAQHPLALRAGSAHSQALVIPSGIGSFPTVKLLIDGRLIIRGDQGTKPLTVQLGWPTPGSSTREMKVVTISRRAATLA